jgi:hypothetical protein
MKKLVVNVGQGKSRRELCTLILTAMDAPEWHGNNRDALDESVSYGSNDTIEPPYSVTLTDVGKLSAKLRADLQIVSEIFKDAKQIQGREVSCELVE